MDKTVINGKLFRFALLWMLAMIMPALNSCKQKSADTGDLLSTVPSSAGLVTGINIRSLLEKSGCKVNGADITPGKEISAWIDRQKDNKDSNVQAMKLILDGESGVDPNVAVCFTDAYNTYLTAMLADTKKFESFAETQSGEKFESADNGVRTCGNIAVKGAQVWICVSSRNTIDSKAVANYASLGESQSFLKNGFSSRISNMTTDIVGWGDIKALTKQGFSMRELSSLNLLAGMLFEDAISVSFTIDFQKGKATGSLNVLNSKGEVAKYLLPASKVDMSTVKSVATDARLLVAMTITKDFTRKIEKIGSSLGGNMFGMFTEALKPVDGTVVVASGDMENIGTSLAGIITTDGNPSRDFLSLLGQFGDTKTEGKLVKLSKGTVSGGLNVEKASGYLKGCVMGVVADMQTDGAGGIPASFLKTLAVALVPDGNGLRCDVTLESTDTSKNLLLSLIEEAGKE